MQFAKTYQWVLNGTKSETRRPVKQTEWAEMSSYNNFGVFVDSPVIRAVHFYSNNGVKWRVGNTYAVQPGRGQKAVARFKLTSIKREPVNAITEAGAVSEGFTGYDVISHGPSGETWCNPVTPVEEFAMTWDEIHGAGSFASGVEVWVLGFELAED